MIRLFTLIIGCLFFHMQFLVAEIEDNITLDNKEIERISVCIANLLYQDLNGYAPQNLYDFELVLKTLHQLYEKKLSPLAQGNYYDIMQDIWDKINVMDEKKNLAVANDYMQKISQNINVKVIEPGKLCYTILQEGINSPINLNGTPLLHFKEMDLVGSIKRDTYKKSPLRISLKETIKGFALGVNGMREGEKRIIYVHPDLAYGKEGYEPNQLIIFEVELLSE